MLKIFCLVACLSAGGAVSAVAQGPTPPQVPTPTDVKPGSINHEDVPYPYPVSYLPFVSYGQDVRMAFMDVPPAGQPNGRTVVLLHGMNFAGFYWAGPIDALRAAGFRDDMALNTKRVLGGTVDGVDFSSAAKRIASTIPAGAQLVLEQGAGHVLHYERPDVFNRELLKFLKSESTSATQGRN